MDIEIDEAGRCEVTVISINGDDDNLLGSFGENIRKGDILTIDDGTGLTDEWKVVCVGSRIHTRQWHSNYVIVEIERIDDEYSTPGEIEMDIKRIENEEARLREKWANEIWSTIDEVGEIVTDREVLKACIQVSCHSVTEEYAWRWIIRGSEGIHLRGLPETSFDIARENALSAITEYEMEC